MLTIYFHLLPSLRMHGTPSLLSHIPSCCAWAQLLFTYVSVVSILPAKGQCQHLNDSMLFFLSQKTLDIKYDLSINSHFWLLMVSVERTLRMMLHKTLCVFSGRLKNLFFKFYVLNFTYSCSVHIFYTFMLNNFYFT